MSVSSTSNTTTTFTKKGHAEKILQKMWNKRQNEDFCDVVIIAGHEEKRIPAHRSVLSEASEYFSGMFTSSLRESTSKVVKILEVNADVLQSLIGYCYLGSVVISQDNVVELLKTAHMLLLEDVVTACENFLVKQLHPSNCLGLAFLAEQYNCDLLLQTAEEYSLENFVEISRADEFLRLSVEKLSQLLASDDLCVETEEHVFNSLIRWMQHDPIEREKNKAELLKLIRTPFLEESFLIEHIKPICNSVECLRVYMEALEMNVLSNRKMPGVQNFAKPRNSSQVLIMGISQNMSNNKMFIHYYCRRRCSWMKSLKELDYRCSFGRVLMGDCLYIIGGNDAKHNKLNTAVCLNLNTMTLTELAPMNEHHKWYNNAASLNGFLYEVGGDDGSNYHSSVEKFNPETNKWYKVASMSVVRINPGTIVLNEKLYVVGGWSDGEDLNTVEFYDAVKDVWQSIAPMSEGRELPGVAVVNGLLYAVGGVRRKTAERYDPQTNKWTSICSLREELCPNGACFTLNDKVVVSFKDHFEEYDAASNEWKKMNSVKHPGSMDRLFVYSGKLRTSQFNEM